MIGADDFLDPARAPGFDFYTGVPCSFLTPFINRVIGDPASPTWRGQRGRSGGHRRGRLAGRQETVVMFQNSGLGNAVNPLTSLNYPFRIPRC